MNVEVLEQLREHDPIYLTLFARRGTLELGRNPVQFRAIQLTQPVGVLLHQGRVLSPHFYGEDRRKYNDISTETCRDISINLCLHCNAYTQSPLHTCLAYLYPPENLNSI